MYSSISAMLRQKLYIENDVCAPLLLQNKRGFCMNDPDKNECTTRGIITLVQAQQKKKQRYNIYIDHEYAFSVHEDVLIAHRLLKDTVIHEEEIKNIIRQEEKQKMVQASVRYLSYRARTTKEVHDYLLRKQFDEELIEDIIHKLLDQGYLNDESFAQQWVQERLFTKQKGSYLLREELKQKGIENHLISDALSRISFDQEAEVCLVLARKKYHTYRHNEDWTIKQKVCRYLQGRGFSFEIIECVYERLMKEKNDHD